MKQVNVNIPDIFCPLFEPATYKVLYGGRYGMKSHTFAELALLTALQKKTRILCTREKQNSIRDSVHHLLKKKIEKNGYSKYFKVSDQSIVCKATGSDFIFKGCWQNVDSIKSMEDLGVIWIEEGQAVSQYSIDVLLPTLLRNKSCELWVSYNPHYETDPINKFVESPRPGSIVIQSSYKDTLAYDYLTDEAIQDIEFTKDRDHEKYLWIYEGHYRAIGDEVIFKGFYKVQEFDGDPSAIYYHGADFGFSQHPCAAVRCYVKDNILYIVDECGGLGIGLEKLPEMYRKLQGGKGTFEDHAKENYKNWEIPADNSRTETIDYVARRGINMVACKKWSGCVEDGIEHIKSFSDIIIHPRCKNTIYEFGHYKYKVDPKTEKVLPVIVKENDHYIDALRYALEGLIRNSGYNQNIKMVGV